MRQCGSLSDSRRRPELLLAVYWTRHLAPPESLLLAQCANVAVSVTPAEGPSCCWRYIGLGTYPLCFWAG